MRRLRLLLADDHQMVAQGLKAVLSRHHEVVAIVRDGAGVVPAVNEFRPDIVLLDVSLPSRSGLDILDDLRSRPGGPRVIVVTMHADPVVVRDAFRRGAHGFVPKDSAVEELLTAMDEVCDGRRYVSPRVPREPPRAGAGARVGFHRLTRRQREVVRLLGRGLNSEQIAEAIGLSPWTVHFHRKRIRRRLGLRSDLELHEYAWQVRDTDAGP